MKEQSDTTVAMRRRMPAEWEQQEAVWVSWPLNPVTWPTRMQSVWNSMSSMVSALSRHAKVWINADPARVDAIRRLLELEGGIVMDQIRFSGVPTNDAWCRDHGATLVQDLESGRLCGLDWDFNAWGDKYQPWDDDNRVASAMSALLGFSVERSPFRGEGGGLEVNGAGMLLLTRSVWLNPNRNPGVTAPSIEAWMKPRLGVDQVFWFERGMEQDDTDGHVDMVCRFVSPNALVFAVERNPRGLQYRAMQELREQAESIRMPGGGHPDLLPLPLPDAVYGEDGRILPATYANFLPVNGLVLVPQYGQERNDANAMGILGECFPGKELVGVDCRDFIREGGAIHCLTQQQPSVRSEKKGLIRESTGGF